MEALIGILILAVILEAVIQVLKGFVPKDTDLPVWLWPVVGAILGIVMCVAARADMLALVGIPLSIPYLGSVLAGVIISRGASFVHDVWKQINGAADGDGASGSSGATGAAGGAGSSGATGTSGT